MSQLTNYVHRIRNFSVNARSFLGCVVLSFISLGAMQVILGLYFLELGYTESFVGKAVAARTLATGILAIPAGALIEKMGPKRILLMASFLIGSSLIVQGITSNKIILIGANLIYGSAFAILLVMMAPFLSNNSDDNEREELFSFNFILMTAARTIGTLLVGFLPPLFFNTILAGKTNTVLAYQYVLITLGIISLGAIIPALFIYEKENKFNCSKKKARLVTSLKKKRIRRLSLYQLFFGIGSGMIAPFFSVFLAKNLGAGSERVSTIMFLYRAAIALALFLTPLLTNKFGKVKSVGVAQFGSLPFLLAIVLVPNFAVVSMAFLLRGALVNMARPIASDFAMEITPDTQQTIASSLMRTSKSIAHGGSATAAGWIINHFGYQATYFLTFCFYFISALLFVKSFRELEQKELQYRTG
ncbi:MFS transporter [Halothermothrix orenii]|nr:MFS transporter [Halothermothrix orenii]